MGAGMPSIEERLRVERDLYRGLLELGAADDPRPLLEEAVKRAVTATRARQGYLALYGGADLASDPPFWLSHDCTIDDVRELRTRISTGIVRQSLERGQTISTASAIEDPRFMALESVSIRGIRAVLCAPIGDSRLGVVYVQGRQEPGPFSEDDRRLLEDIARHVAPYAERLLDRREKDDPTAPWRKQLAGLGAIAGRSKALADVFRQMALVAPLDVTVLLTGGSGVGKTTLARALHASGPRAAAPFIELSCAALPENLIESELFGAERGAHSTADRTIMGKVEAAEGGTLFLDEIGELPIASQSKLLSLIQSRTYYRLGGTDPRNADVRLIAATNVDLAAAVKARTFREDLFYRLAVVPIAIAPLEERREDVVPIAEAALHDAARRHRLPSLPLASAARAALEASEWPGNVRQLANTIEAGLIRAAGEGAAQIGRRHLFLEMDEPEREDASFHGATQAFQRRLLERVLGDEDWNVSAVARRLDLSRSRVNELLGGFTLKRP
jgi:Nif-specific regulatory protein